MRKTKLTVLGIKQKINKKKRKKRTPKTSNSSVQVSRLTQETSSQTGIKSFCIKTRDIAVGNHVRTACKKVSVGSPFVDRWEKWTNTKRLYRIENSTQTERDTWAIATQCLVPVCTRATQSENSRGCMPTQTELLVLNKSTQTTLNDTTDVDNLQNQFKYTLHIFNELCQMLSMQNNLLNSNFSMVCKLADVNQYEKLHSMENLNVEKTLQM